jgi:hypothetical protein
MLEYWSEDVRFEIPGNHKYAGWHEGPGCFFGIPGNGVLFFRWNLSGRNLTILVNAEKGYPVDVNRNWGTRPGCRLTALRLVTSSMWTRCTCCAGKTARSSRGVV